MTAAMDSPERNPIIASNDSQGSPFFNFLCSLSPIKPVKSSHVAQTFSELSFPPPPAVFVSPKVDTQKDSVRSKRKILAGKSEITQATKSEGFDAAKSSSLLFSSVEDRTSSWSRVANCHQNNFGGTVTAGSGFTLPHGSPLKPRTIQDFEDCSSEPEMIVSQHSSGGNADILKRQSGCSNRMIDEQPPKQDIECLTSHELSVSSLQEESNSVRQESAGTCALSSNQEGTIDSSFRETQVRHLDIHGNYLQISNLDESAVGFSCQSMSEKGKGASHDHMHDFKKLAASWSEIPVEYLSRILASMHGIVGENAQTVSFNPDFLQSSHGPLNLHKSEELQAESGQQGCRASTAGVRRRCLDFETLETQQRNLDKLPMLRMIGLSSDNPSRNTFSDTSVANRASTFSETIALESGGMKNQFPKVLSHGILASSNLPLLPQYAMQNSCLASRKNAIYLPFQGDTDLTSRDCDPVIPFGGEPSGIGLHLNGLRCSMPLTHPVVESTVNSGAFPLSARVENSARLVPLDGFIESSSGSDENPLQGRRYTQVGSARNLGQGLILSLVERTSINQHEMQLATNSAQVGISRSTTCYQSVTLGIDSIEENLNAGELESESTPLGEKRVVVQDISHQSESDQAEDSSHSPKSPKKKRKLSNQTGDNQGESCKNCKCKKSKCLKLYCECFAAGVYCIDVCNCHDCFNKPEFEETVLGTRQQIESRNPLAFVPKIIRASDSSPTIGEDFIDTPASARHKRGCNCKKSQCLKKYCECYQAGVGCADGCRCEGCKNIYGRNEGSGEVDDKDQQTAVLEMKITSNDELIAMDVKHTPEHQNEQKIRDLSPITPYLEHSGQCRSDMELGSNEKLSALFTLPAPTIAFRSPSTLFESSDGTENFGRVNAHPHLAAGTSKVTDSGRLSPGWDGLSDIYTLTPLPRPLQRLAPVVVDAVLENNDTCYPLWQGHEHLTSNISSHLPSLTSRESTQSSLIQQLVPLLFPSDTYQFQTPENALTIPVTPLLSSSTHVSRPNYDFEEISDTQSHQSVWFSDEDDSPHVLKESNAICAPDIVMKTRSPQQKRVFSYQQNMKSTNLREIVSPGSGLKSGRKFILHALPSSGCPDKPGDLT